MSTSVVITTFFFLLAMVASTFCLQQPNPIQVALDRVLQATNWVQSSIKLHELGSDDTSNDGDVALRDCAQLYDESAARLMELLSNNESYSGDDARTWLSGLLANQRTCLDGLDEKGFNKTDVHRVVAENLTMVLGEALAFYGKGMHEGKRVPPREQEPKPKQNEGLLVSWSPGTSRADFVVAKDGSGTHRTINEAVAALVRMGHRRPPRVIIYVKPGVYQEKVELHRNIVNVMLVGAGIDKTIITGSHSYRGGLTTRNSATFGVSGDGFWARDITFENTAGPEMHQAVALRVSSDITVFYRCSIKGYQDTLYVHANRQFYRDCQIYGTIDFIFGNAIAVLQNCDIFVRRPMNSQSNMITAQGRDKELETTGIVIHGCRVRPAPEFARVKGSFRSYLGRPWKRFSRTVFMKTDLDGLIDPKGWTEWRGSYGLSTLFYGEYMNTGTGASTEQRVKWPGFHVLNSPQEASPFTVNKFIQGQFWLPATGVPFWPGI
ncbi:PREDICTED: pectinesterase [Prunus dulcis]|uniref:Pectinesterase n=1 Tax=Prunus dulcis TaxID=3755 RepID=A0A5E4G3D8_PRUDU|nr:PREDICTED: pectinesterase [Prunus dulcis]